MSTHDVVTAPYDSDKYQAMLPGYFSPCDWDGVSRH